MLTKTTVVMAAAGAGLCFVGYCIYFDRKRRSHPDFKKNLRERRQNKKTHTASSGTGTPFPDLKDSDAMQKFFMQEIQIGEAHLATGNIEEGVEHITNAVAVCGQPQQLLSILQQTLPAQVFKMLLERLPKVSEKMSSAIMTEATQAQTPAVVTELELE